MFRDGIYKRKKNTLSCMLATKEKSKIEEKNDQEKKLRNVLSKKRVRFRKNENAQVENWSLARWRVYFFPFFS